jgi:cell division protein FtsZ
MGGGTGTGAAPVVSNIAKEQGAIVVGMVSTPFNVERARTVKAEEGLERLRDEADSIIVLDNNRLLDYVPNLPIGKAFSVMDQIIAETVKGISETITQPSLINLDYADMSTIMNQGGVAVMLVGETQDSNKTDEVVNDAMNHPLLDVDYRGATGGLVHITGGPDLTLKEAEGIADSITERLEASANVIWGARIQEEYKGKVRVMAIMTGVQSAQVLGSGTQQQANESRRPRERRLRRQEQRTGGNAARRRGPRRRRPRPRRQQQQRRRHPLTSFSRFSRPASRGYTTSPRTVAPSCSARRR